MNKKRIALALTPAVRGKGYEVPDSAVGEGFVSEAIETRIQMNFLNYSDWGAAEMVYSEAGLRAESEGFDAFIVPIMDYGVAPLKASLSIPVVGCAEAALQLASGLGETFGILTIWPDLTGPSYRRMLRSYGANDACSGIRHVTRDIEFPGMTDNGGLIDEMRDGKQDVLDRVIAEGRELVEEGTDVIILGCTCMSPIRDAIAAALPVPVIDSRLAGQRLAETLVLMGLSQTPPKVPASHTDMIRAMVNGAGVADMEDVEELCGDTCSIIHPDSERAPVTI